MILEKRHTPRWLIFIIDILISAFSFVVAYLLRFEFKLPEEELPLAINFIGIFIGVRGVSFVLGKTYAGIIRYTSTQDSSRIFTVVTFGSLFFILLNQIRFHFFDGVYFIPYSIIAIEYLVTLFALIVSRVAVKVLYIELKTPTKAKTRVVIYGAGESGIITKRTLDRDQTSGIAVVAFLDDDKSKSGKKIEGASIYHTDKSDDLFSSGNIDQIIISVQKISRKKKAIIIKKALEFNIEILDVPPVKSWIKGELSVKQIRNIRIEDLLGREAIKLESVAVRKQVEGKVILVTGAAGSIGSELVRQLISYNPKKIIVFDQAETPLFDLENDLKRNGNIDLCEFMIGDVRQADRMKRLFSHYRPEVVYHAAAYKHVPLMEDNPTEAVLTNVHGTRVLVDVASDFGVEKFVQVSTDKAVNPTNVMGATKRVAEIYAQAKNSVSKTKYITTRFGNVLGSNGSVIPLFKQQIDDGGPLTVTHKDVTRFFMTIPEAVQLVLEAGTMGEGGEIFVFDMGESIKIIDLAKNMVKLSGLELGKDIEIEIVGLRPGEKLFEELLSVEENTIPTHHQKILKAKVREYDYRMVSNDVNDLTKLFDLQNNEKLVSKLKDLVPEYKSQNSVFSELD